MNFCKILPGLLHMFTPGVQESLDNLEHLVLGVASAQGVHLRGEGGLRGALRGEERGREALLGLEGEEEWSAADEQVSQ